MALQIRRALISVSDKTAVTDFAQALADTDVEILSTGGRPGITLPRQCPFLNVPMSPPRSRKSRAAYLPKNYAVNRSFISEG